LSAFGFSPRLGMPAALWAPPSVFFWLVLTPMGLLLRLWGKDLLTLRRRTTSTTYWRSARISDQFDRQF